MRRTFLVVLCCMLLMTAALASGQASSIQSAATVDSNGDCQVMLIASIHLDAGQADLTFPLPANAKNIKVNNSRAQVHRTADAAQVALGGITGGIAGDFTVTFSYTIPSVVSAEETGYVLTMPLLCGFVYPVEKMEFSVTLPGSFDTRPTFSSGYYQESIESSLSYSINGATISGVLPERLQDHETLTMRLQVPEELFYQSVTAVFAVGPYRMVMMACALLAFVYWVLTMRSLPFPRVRCAAPPEGISAGEIGSRLVHQGVDLTMMVLTWAQMGYLVITMDESGRVFLHKSMDMGNERNAFENYYFRSLFKRGRTLDGTSYRYAKLCRKAASENPSARNDFRPGSGNPKLLRALCAGVGAAAGAALGGSLAGSFAWRIVLGILLGVGGAAASWFIQAGCGCIYLRDKRRGRIGLACIAVWMLLSLIGGQWQMTLLAILMQIIGGLAAAYSGRRSVQGKQTASEILGLRRYLKTVSKEELQRILKVNPDYYYELAPYALALGVDKTFAKRFERLQQPNCTYLMTGIETDRTAMGWYPLLRDVVDALNTRQERLWMEKFFR